MKSYNIAVMGGDAKRIAPLRDVPRPVSRSDMDLEWIDEPDLAEA